MRREQDQNVEIMVRDKETIKMEQGTQMTRDEEG